MEKIKFADACNHFTQGFIGKNIKRACLKIYQIVEEVGILVLPMVEIILPAD